MRRHNAGMSLVEVLVGLVIGLCVLAGAIRLLSVALRWTAGAEQQLARREGAATALAAIRRGLADAWGYRMDVDGITFWTPAGVGQVRLRGAGRTLTYRAPGETRASLQVSGLDGFALQMLRPGLVRVTVRLGARLMLSDDVLMPAVAERAVEMPWAPPVEPAAI